MKIDDKKVLTCGTKPNAILKLSKSNVSEETFRSECDSSKHILQILLK